MSIKAIETVYNGYRFRSRLEARWAVFFDTLGIKYEYEKEGYDLEGVWYLPDFWLPEQDCYVEIKGEYPQWEEICKAFLLAWYSGKMVYIFWGNVGLPSPENGILSFGRMGLRKGDEEELTVIPLLEFKERLASDNGIALNDFRVSKKGLFPLEELKVSLVESMPDDMRTEIDLFLYYDFELWVSCPFCMKIGIFPYGYCTLMPCECCGLDGWAKEDGHKTNWDSPLLIMAYNAARQKRFEHGEGIERVYPQPVNLPEDDAHGLAADEASAFDRQYFLDHPDEVEYMRPYFNREMPYPFSIQPDLVHVRKINDGVRSRVGLWVTDTEEEAQAIASANRFQMNENLIRPVDLSVIDDKLQHTNVKQHKAKQKRKQAQQSRKRNRSQN